MTCYKAGDRNPYPGDGTCGGRGSGRPSPDIHPTAPKPGALGPPGDESAKCLVFGDGAQRAIG